MTVIDVELQLPDGSGSAVPSGPEPGDVAAIRWPFTSMPSNVGSRPTWPR